MQSDVIQNKVFVFLKDKSIKLNFKKINLFLIDSFTATK